MTPRGFPELRKGGIMRYAVLACVVFLAGACGDRPLPTAPSTPTSSPEPSAPAGPVSYKLSGVVYESGPNGRRVLPGVPLDISKEFQSWKPQTSSDAEGRYQISSPSGSELKVAAEVPGYSQPCRAGVVLTADTTLDVYLVPNTILATSGIPASMPLVGPTASGRVVERTPEGLRPVAEANVAIDFSGGMGWAPSATTVTDAAGRFMLCGVSNLGLGHYILASKTGFALFYEPLDLARSSTHEIELTRTR